MPKKAAEAKVQEATKLVALTIRIPEPVHRTLGHVAVEENRSLNEQIAVALSDWLATVADEPRYQGFIRKGRG